MSRTSKCCDICITRAARPADETSVPMSASCRDQVTGVVLAGGRSRRMGGVNKALVDYHGQPLFRYAVNNLLSCCDRVVINTLSDRDAFRRSGFDTVDDGGFAGRGPVAGVYAGLRHATTPFVAIAACDQLTLPDTVYPTLCATVTESRGVFARTTTDEVPTCAVLPVCLAEEARRALDNERLALRAFMRAYAEPVRFDGVEFGNINTPDQITRR